jgi:hypothetical protein
MSAAVFVAVVLFGGATVSIASGRTNGSAPSGYKLETVRRAGFSIAIPMAWDAFDLTTEHGSAALAAFNAANPMSGLPDRNQIASLQFVAIDPGMAAPRSGVLVQLNPKVHRLPSLASQRRSIAQANKQALRLKPPAVTLQVRELTLSGCRAQEVRPTYMPAPDASLRAGLTLRTTYEVAGKPGMFSVGFATAGDPGTDPTVQSIIHTFQVRK